MWGVCVSALVGCGSESVRSVGGGEAACVLLDSLYERSGFERRVLVQGTATVDANQYKMRGQVRLDCRSPNEIVFEFASTVLFGTQREDFLLALQADTVRIVDRERGAYYEGDEAEAFLSEALEADFGIARSLPLALGAQPPCGEIDDISFSMDSVGGVVCTGKRFGERFKVVFGADHSRLEKVEWPVRCARYGVDRMRVEYTWQSDGRGGMVLSEIVLRLEEREWRCKIKKG